MALINDMDDIPQIGESVESIKESNYIPGDHFIEVEFESGRTLTCHVRSDFDKSRLQSRPNEYDAVESGSKFKTFVEETPDEGRKLLVKENNEQRPICIAEYIPEFEGDEAIVTNAGAYRDIYDDMEWAYLDDVI